MGKVAGVAAAAVILALAGMTSGCSQQDGGASAAGKLGAGAAPHADAAAAQPNAAQPGKAGAGARKPGDKPLWRSLTPAQQLALQPLAGEWDQMDGVRKQKWLQLASRFAAMPTEEQQRVQERMREWAKLTPEQRELARETFNRTRKITADQKTATWESYQQLPDDQKKKLAASVTGRKAPSVVPSQASGKAAVQLGFGATACPAGSVRNSVSATPPCVAVPAPVAAPQPPQQQPAPVTPPAAPVNPPPPPPPEKQVPANWGISPNNA